MGREMKTQWFTYTVASLHISHSKCKSITTTLRAIGEAVWFFCWVVIVDFLYVSFMKFTVLDCCLKANLKYLDTKHNRVLLIAPCVWKKYFNKCHMGLLAQISLERSYLHPKLEMQFLYIIPIIDACFKSLNYPQMLGNVRNSAKCLPMRRKGVWTSI